MVENNPGVGSRFGKYELTALLGRGGMGEVYEAVDTDKGRTVALKILRAEFAHDEQFRTRFLRESRAAAGLEEPHVVPIHDWARSTATSTSTCAWSVARRCTTSSAPVRSSRAAPCPSSSRSPRPWMPHMLAG